MVKWFKWDKRFLHERGARKIANVMKRTKDEKDTSNYENLLVS